MTDKPRENPTTAKVTPLRPSQPCPICKQPSVRSYHPFCSKRCADVDLNRWFGDHYAVPVIEEDGARTKSPSPSADHHKNHK